MQKRAAKIISDNQKAWDEVFGWFLESTYLPTWGPFGVGKDLDLIPKIKGRVFLEVGCGSGRSIEYLINKGAKKVYGLDISSKQIEESAAHNKKELEKGTMELINSPMEDRVNIQPVDIVFSVYAIGWTVEPQKTLKNIYSYLKPGGLFIWSWDHSLFANVQYKDGNLVVTNSYHEENTRTINNWKKRGIKAKIAYRKTSTWFQLLRDAGFEVIGYHEPQPVSLNGDHDDPSRYYSIQKATKVPSTFIFVCKK